MAEPQVAGVAVRVFAPAKINLTLHVLGQRPDGYHLIDSLIAFADIGDTVTARPAPDLSLTVSGPEGGAVAALGEDNLVLHAAHRLAEATGVRAGARLHLAKHLPAAAGIGGGSSDAAATLRALERVWRHPMPPAALAALALKLGADVPACLAARPIWVGGIGERVCPAPGLPPAGIVLANPRQMLATAAVFAARRGAFGKPGRVGTLPRDAAGLAEMLATRRNDLSEAALTLLPDIARVLHCLAGLPGALIARMSGSGATCFALFADRAAALAAGRRLAEAEPSWWSAAGALLTEPPSLETVAP